MRTYRRSHGGLIYFFTVVTHDRRPILTSDLGHRALKDAIKTVQDNRPFDIVAMVTLPDHLHAVWQLPENDADYSIRWSWLKSEFTRDWLSGGGAEGKMTSSRRSKRERAVWQRRFWEHQCKDDGALKRCVDYVHVNPLKHRLVKRVADWPWSTFHRFVKNREYELDWGNASHWYGDEFANAE